MPYSDEVAGFVGTIKRYSIKSRRPLAFGRESVIWLCNDEQTNQEVVIKAFRDIDMPKESWKRFFREIKVLQSLSHPNILPILDWGFEGSDEVSDPFVVLPYCKGGNLRSELEGRNFLTPEGFLPLLEQIALAVDFAHKQGIIHNDIKPENLLFIDSKKKYICLSDFGIAKILPFNESMTTEGGGAGTTAYLSPEQIVYNQQSHLSDIYSLTVVAYEALTGKLPFDTTAPPFQQMRQKADGSIIDPTKINPLLSQSIKDALLTGLSVNPSKRPQTASELCNLLKNHSAVTQSSSPKKKSFWSSLPPTQKVAVITGVIAAIATIITAIVSIIPDLLK